MRHLYILIYACLRYAVSYLGIAWVAFLLTGRVEDCREMSQL